MKNRDRIERQMEEAARMDKVARISYWQTLGSRAIFDAAGELVRRHCEEHGIDPKFDRTIGFYHRGPLPNEK